MLEEKELLEQEKQEEFEKDKEILSKIVEMLENNGIEKDQYITWDLEAENPYISVNDKDDRGIHLSTTMDPLKNGAQIAISRNANSLMPNEAIYTNFPSVEQWNKFSEEEKNATCKDLFLYLQSEEILLANNKMHNTFALREIKREISRDSYEFNINNDKDNSYENTVSAIRGHLAKDIIGWADQREENNQKMICSYFYEKLSDEKQKDLLIETRGYSETIVNGMDKQKIIENLVNNLKQDKQDRELFEEKTVSEEPKISGIFRNFMENNVQTFRELGKWASGKTKEVFDKFEDKFNKVGNWTHDKIDDLKDIFSSATEKFKEVASRVGENIKYNTIDNVKKFYYSSLIYRDSKDLNKLERELELEEEIGNKMLGKNQKEFDKVDSKFNKELNKQENIKNKYLETINKESLLLNVAIEKDAMQKNLLETELMELNSPDNKEKYSSIMTKIYESKGLAIPKEGFVNSRINDINEELKEVNERIDKATEACKARQDVINGRVDRVNEKIEELNKGRETFTKDFNERQNEINTLIHKECEEINKGIDKVKENMQEHIMERNQIDIEHQDRMSR